MDGTRRKFFQDATIFGAGLLGLSARLKGAPSNEKSQNLDQKSQRHAANASTHASPARSGHHARLARFVLRDGWPP